MTREECVKAASEVLTRELARCRAEKKAKQ